MLTTQTFHEWTALLELTQRSSVKPNVACSRLNLTFEQEESLAVANGEHARPLVEDGGNADGQHVEVNGKSVQCRSLRS